MVSFRCHWSVAPVASKILVVLWAFSLWSQLDGFISSKQLRPKGVLRACLPPGLDVEKWQDCAPKLLEADRFEQMLQEAKKLNQTYPKNRNPPRVPDEQGRWKCNKCGQVLPKKAFTLQKSGGRKIPYFCCKECKCKIFRLFHRSVRGTLQQILGSARRRAKAKGLPCTLTPDDLYRMIKGQRGRCAYSGVPMEICMPNSHWRMSLERRNNSIGYSRQNCVLVAGEFNTGDFSQGRGVNRAIVKGTAQWSPSKVQAVFQLRRQKVDLQVFHGDVRKALEKPKLHQLPCQAEPLDGPSAAQPGQIRCSRCQRFLAPRRFTPSERVRGGYCIACKREYNQAFSSTLRGHVQNCLMSARPRARKRNQGSFACWNSKVGGATTLGCLWNTSRFILTGECQLSGLTILQAIPPRIVCWLPLSSTHRTTAATLRPKKCLELHSGRVKRLSTFGAKMAGPRKSKSPQALGSESEAWHLAI